MTAMLMTPEPLDAVAPVALAAAAPPRTSDAPSGPLWWAGLAVGGAIMTFGAWGLWDALDGVRLLRWVGWFAAGLLVHDGLVVPSTVAVGWLVRRVVPAGARATVQAGLALSAVLALVTWPLVRGYGRAAQGGTNPTLLPFDYGRNLLVVLAVVWGSLAAAAVARRVARSRRAGRA
jgi:hypothetical protein